MRRWTIINMLLALIVALLTVEIVRTWARALPPIEVSPAPPAPTPAPPKRDKGEQAPQLLVTAIVEKDLFDASRRPPSEETVTAEVVRETGPPPGVAIVGTRIMGKDREVFLTDASQGNVQRRLRVGDQVAGYTIKSIEPTAVTLSSPSGDPVTMPLALEKGKAPAPAPPTPPRAPAAARATPPTPVPGQVAPQGQQLPDQVRQKLEQLKQSDRARRRGGAAARGGKP
jgi:hypothetical protein